MDLDRKVRRGRERLAQDVEVPHPLPMPVDKSEQLSILEEKIKNLLESVEALGEAGKVDEAEVLMRKETKEKAREEERAAREKEAEEWRKLREKEVDGGHRSGSADRDKNRHRETDRTDCRDRERSRDRNNRGNHNNMGRAPDRRYNNNFRNGGDRNKDRYRGRDNSRSRSLLGMGEDSHPEVRIIEICRLEVRRACEANLLIINISKEEKSWR